MTDKVAVRIIYTHDGEPVAQMLMRLLSAEDHAVEICTNRSSLDALEGARDAAEAVILIWSVDAASTLYMLQWAQAVPTERLIEITRSSSLPQLPGKRPAPIDFSSWSGERGGHAWRTLNDRLRAVENALKPKQPAPVRAVAAMAAVSLIAVGAAWEEIQHAKTPSPAPTPSAAPADTVALAHPSALDGVGGPLVETEPASADPNELHFGRPVRAQLLGAGHSTPLADEPTIATTQHFESHSLLQRLADLTAPLRPHQDPET